MTNECGHCQETEQRSGYGDKRGLSNRESLVYVRENLIFDTFVGFSYGEI